jgi:integrase
MDRIHPFRDGRLLARSSGTTLEISLHMGNRGKRIRLATGIYQDRYGITVRPGETRFPLGTPLEQLRRARREAIEEREGTLVRRGTLGAGFEAYLLSMPEGPRRRDERALLLHWRDAGFEPLAPNSVQPVQVQQQLAKWAGRFTPATLGHLRRVLGAVYRAINGKAGYNPVRDVPTIHRRYEEPRAIPYDLIELILSQMPDLGMSLPNTAKKKGGAGRSPVNKTKIRLRVMAYTGLPPAQLGRILPRDLDLKNRHVLARPRRKGAGSDARLLPLTDRGVQAFELFQAAECFGPFSSRAAARVWRRAITRTRKAWEKEHQRPWPLADDVRAYDLRHSFGTELLLATGDLKLVGDMLLHSSLSTTARYTLAAVEPRLRTGADALSKRLEDGSLRGSRAKSLKTEDNHG